MPSTPQEGFLASLFVAKAPKRVLLRERAKLRRKMEPLKD